MATITCTINTIYLHIYTRVAIGPSRLGASGAAAPYAAYKERIEMQFRDK